MLWLLQQHVVRSIAQDTQLLATFTAGKSGKKTITSSDCDEDDEQEENASKAGGGSSRRSRMCAEEDDDDESDREVRASCS